MFTSTPSSYGSLYESQIFKFESTFIEDHTYEIKEVNSGKLLGVKKFYQTDDVSLNVAPIVRPYAIPTPQYVPTGYIEDSNFGMVAISVTKSGSVETTEVVSDEVILSLSQSDETDTTVISTLPLTRAMVMGDSELLLVKCSSEDAISIIVSQYAYNWSGEESESAIAEDTYYYTDNGQGFVLFSIAANLMDGVDEDVVLERITVSVNRSFLLNPGAFVPIYANESISELTYYIVESQKSPMRLAWVSSRGSVEHYTMPYITSQMVQRGGGSIYTLRSALETFEVREALAEMVSAEAVWVVQDGEYIEVELVDEEIEISPEEDLATLQFKIYRRD